MKRRRRVRHENRSDKRPSGDFEEKKDEDEIDIEDSLMDEGDEQRMAHVPAVSKRRAGARNRAAVDEHKPAKNVPGSQRVFVRTYGCSHNTSDAEFMSGQLESYGYVLVDNLDNA